MTNKETDEFVEYCKQQLPILQEQEKRFDRSSIKTWNDSKKYWHLKESIVIFNDVIRKRKYDLAEYYRDCMKLAVECLEHSKTVSKEIQSKWYQHYGSMIMDFVGEAHCKVGTQFFPRCGNLVAGDEKRIWEEIIELGHRFYELN